MADSTLLLVNISRAAFFVANIWLTYSFLTPRRPVWFQIAAFAGTWVAQYLARLVLTPTGLDTFLIGHILTILYFVPIALIFKETLH